MEKVILKYNLHDQQQYESEKDAGRRNHHKND